MNNQKLEIRDRKVFKELRKKLIIFNQNLKMKTNHTMRKLTQIQKENRYWIRN